MTGLADPHVRMILGTTVDGQRALAEFHRAGLARTPREHRFHMRAARRLARGAIAVHTARAQQTQLH